MAEYKFGPCLNLIPLCERKEPMPPLPPFLRLSEPLQALHIRKEQGEGKSSQKETQKKQTYLEFGVAGLNPPFIPPTLEAEPAPPPTPPPLSPPPPYPYPYPGEYAERDTCAAGLPLPPLPLSSPNPIPLPILLPPPLPPPLGGRVRSPVYFSKSAERGSRWWRAEGPNLL